MESKVGNPLPYFHFNLLQSPFEFFHCVPFVLLAFFRLNDLELFILVVDRTANLSVMVANGIICLLYTSDAADD